MNSSRAIFPDVVLAISGDAGTAIRDASKDMEDFGNYSDGTAQILEQKVVDRARQRREDRRAARYSAESIEALGTAASLISPELLRATPSSRRYTTRSPRWPWARTCRSRVGGLDRSATPRCGARGDSEVDDLAAALGSLSDAPLSSLKEVTDRMKQFAGDMYREVKDSREGFEGADRIRRAARQGRRKRDRWNVGHHHRGRRHRPKSERYPGGIRAASRRYLRRCSAIRRSSRRSIASSQ